MTLRQLLEASLFHAGALCLAFLACWPPPGLLHAPRPLMHALLMVLPHPPPDPHPGNLLLATTGAPARPPARALLIPLHCSPPAPADPHPGNLLATTSGDLVYLDFGMMSEAPQSGGQALGSGLGAELGGAGRSWAAGAAAGRRACCEIWLGGKGGREPHSFAVSKAAARGSCPVRHGRHHPRQPAAPSHPAACLPRVQRATPSSRTWCTW